MHPSHANIRHGPMFLPHVFCTWALAIFLGAACTTAVAPDTPQGGALRAQLSTAPENPEFDLLSSAFSESNEGYALRWLPGSSASTASAAPQVLFVQSGEGAALITDNETSGTTTCNYAVGDLLPLPPGQEVSFTPPADLLSFSLPEALPKGLPTIIRPDWDPAITDTPGGCATETGAYRRILLTWLGKNGPYLYHGLNAHRVRVMDSFTHYHPLVGGFDEFYLVQAAQAGARLIVGEDLPAILSPETVSAEQVPSLLREIPVEAGDLIYLPRGVVHRGLGGILAQVISIPGFVPNSEIGVDENLRAINARLGLKGSLALPVHASDTPPAPATDDKPRTAPDSETQSATRHVVLERLPDRIRFTVDGQLFTEYRLDGRFPAFFPVRNPTGDDMTRAFPFEKRSGERQDHPHHRSLWFAHGDMNGVDFWHDESTVVNQPRMLESGGDGEQAWFTSANTWVDGKGRLICTDERRITAFTREHAFGLDFDITLTASGAGLIIGDTKEGTCAIRLAPGLVADKGGTLQNSSGQKGGAVWGQRSPWLLAQGTVNTRPAAVAILDHPDNPRYPTTWHARTYGLVAANPFGLAAFERKPNGSGALTLKPGESVRFQYRFLFFSGHPDPASLKR
ncbi:MAG: hypothetical protein CMK00_08105 [Planctomycetes bacterium]|nr:hypothetical protein [Planctomycetota bacterium]